MNRRLLIILVVAFLIATMSAILVWRLVGARLAASKSQPTTHTLVAAAKDIKIGSVLASTDLASIQVMGSVPQGAITDQKNAIGRGVIANIYAGEPILDSRLAPMGSGGGLAATIPEGKRACAVKVDDVVGVAGFVTPGMRVDVLISGVPPNSGNNQDTESHTILQNIEVLSAGTDIQKDAEGKPKQVQVVNLLVTPQQAQDLSLAASQMRIQLVLRNPLDTKIAPVPATEMANLFTGEKPAVLAGKPRIIKRKPAPPPPFTIQVINGSQHTEEKFASPGGQK
jgi:pilus assembly protein CpaB